MTFVKSLSKYDARTRARPRQKPCSIPTSKLRASSGAIGSRPGTEAPDFCTSKYSDDNS
jgi:hypothetical protein